jgi:hypothetical protein
MTHQSNPKHFTPQTRAQRESNRAALAILCEVRQGTAPWQRRRLDDLSPGGFRIARHGPVDPLAPVRIRIPGLQVLSARVAWHDGMAVGCAFDTPLHEVVFGHIVAASG